MVSGLPDSDVIQHWIAEEGFDAFPKPFPSNQLAAKVKQMIVASGSELRRNA